MPTAPSNRDPAVTPAYAGGPDPGSFGNFNEIEGLFLSNDEVTPDEIVDISTGSCRSDSGPFITVASILSPDITALGANGLDAGVVAADTWYAVWVIADSQGVVAVAGLFSLSATAPTLPAGYDLQRRVGWVRTDGTSDILIFGMANEEGPVRWVFWKELHIIQLNGTASSYTNTFVSAATRVPPTAVLQQLGALTTKLGGPSQTAHVELIPDDWNEAAGNESWRVAVGINRLADTETNGIFDMPVGPAQLVRYLVAPAGDARTDIAVKGWQDVL